jgi:Domain of unknown function (DUF6456)
MPQILAERPSPDCAADGTPSRRTVTVNLAESPLTWLAARRLISERQAAAGEAIRRDFEQAQLGPRITMRWDACPASSPGHHATDPAGATVAHLAARTRFDGAMAALGPGLQDIAWRLICAGEGMTQAEKELGWPARSGRLVLTLALDRIADYYQLS